MSLNETNRDLYKSESDISKRAHKLTPFNPENEEKAGAQDFQKEEVWMKDKPGMGPNEKKALKITLWSIGSIALVALIVAGIYFIKKTAYSEDRVTIEITGPANIDSTQIAEYAIKFKNDNRVKLENAAIILNYSDNFQPETAENIQVLSTVSSKIHIGEINKHEEREVKIKGKFFAPEDYTVYLRATLEYSSSNTSGVFQSQAQLGVSVKTSPIFLEVTAPLEAADGNDVEYYVNYRNSSAKDYSEIRIRLEYPDGFIFTSSEPRPSESNNFWYIGNLGSNDSGQLKIRGKLKGGKGEGKIVKASLGSLGSDGRFVTYTENEKKTLMVVTPLAITQTINDISSLTFNAGDSLWYVLEYKNTGDTGVREVIITFEMNSPVINYAQIRLETGHYDSPLKSITWKASDIPELANLEPGKSGQIRFSLPILNKFPIESENDKNFTLTTTAKIDSPDVPTPVGSNKIISSSTMDLKLNSKIILESKGYYTDQKMTNTGPMPPMVGEETTYTMHWFVTNVNNDVSDVKVVSSLPTGVKWKGKAQPESENITYNERTNQITWEVGRMKNGVGVLSDKREVYFQIGFIPQTNQVDSQPVILNESVLTAKDLFTTEELRSVAEQKTTSLMEDPTVNGRVKAQLPQ